MATERDATDPPLTPDLLVAAYSQGLFPMARSRGSDRIDWYSPDPRAILPLDGLKVSRSLAARRRSGVFEYRADTAFEQVVLACAAPRAHERETWINDRIVSAYTHLHRCGVAHSIEAWRDGELVGGLYGVSIGGAFFGESMFSRPAAGGTDASKCCLVELVERLRAGGYMLLDVQINSEHMASLGAVDIPLDEYHRRLAEALGCPASWA